MINIDYLEKIALALLPRNLGTLAKRQAVLQSADTLKLRISEVQRRKKLLATNPNTLRDDIARNMDRIEQMRVLRDNPRSATERNMYNARLNRLRNDTRDMVHILQNNARTLDYIKTRIR